VPPCPLVYPPGRHSRTGRAKHTDPSPFEETRHRTSEEHRPEELSGGERQRVAIARALAFDPPVLLADEPTGNLDTHTGAEILKLIRDLHRRLEATILIVTHGAGVAESCSRTVCLRDARIVGDLRR
jgi:putative ABC transport system ATP-binding protein